MRILGGKKTLEIYRDKNGKEPFTEWLESQTSVAQARISKRLRTW